MIKYTCEKMRPIKIGTWQKIGDREINVCNIADAAQVFAQRIATNLYGRRGAVSTVRVDCWTADGRCTNFEAFVGLRTRDRGGVAGRNVRFTVYTTKTV